MATSSPIDDPSVDFLHELGSRMASADALHEVLARVVDFASALMKCDSCLIYVLESGELVLRASKNPHPDVVDRLKLHVGEGITGWVAEHGEPVAVSKNASQDPRFRIFQELPEDTYEAFLSVPLMSRSRVVGVINLQHRRPHVHNQREFGSFRRPDFSSEPKSRWHAWRPRTPICHSNWRHGKLWSARKESCSATFLLMKSKPISHYRGKAGRNGNQ